MKKKVKKIIKKTVRLTESELENIIKEAICEIGDTGKGQRALGALHARKVLNVPGKNKEEYLSNFKKTKDYYDYAAKARGGDDYDNTGRNKNPLYDVYAKGYIDYLKSHPEEYHKAKEKTGNLGIDESKLKSIVRLTESDLHRLVKRMVLESLELKTYYSEELRKEMLELSDEHVLWHIKNNDFDFDHYCFVCDHALKDLSEQYGTEFYALGRSGRHVCVEDTPENRKRFYKMSQSVKDKQNEIISFFNKQGKNSDLDESTIKESYDTDEQWKHEAQLFMRGLRSGKAIVEDDIAYVQIFKKDMAENDPRYVYIRKGDNRLHDDHFYIQDSPVLSKKSLNAIYNRLGWNNDKEEF